MKGFPHLFKKQYLLCILIFLLTFLVRLVYGLCSPFWGTDEKQIYLLGLKYYTTGDFPYYGPDVVYTQTQIPGALQSLLVGIPFHFFSIPEAPFLLLNLLSTASLVYFAYYLHQRIPNLRGWLIYAYLLSLPWTLNYSTHVVNPSYVLPAAIVFFIAVFELLLFYNRPIIHPHCAFGMMGFALLWVMQLHMSFVLLLPYIFACFLFSSENLANSCKLWQRLNRTEHRGKETQRFFRKKDFKELLRNLLFFILGAAMSGSLLLPTYFKYGIAGTGSIEANVELHLEHLTELPTIIARFLSFATYETGIFMGYNLESRLQFLEESGIFAPFIILLTLAGLLQVVYLLWSFLGNVALKSMEGRRIKCFTIISIGVLYCSFLFSVKGPSSHTFYVLFPVSILYAVYCWQSLLSKPFWKKTAVLCLILSLFFHLHLAHNHFKKHSLYKNRTIPQKAIDQKNHKILGNRRSEDWGCCY